MDFLNLTNIILKQATKQLILTDKILNALPLKRRMREKKSTITVSIQIGSKLYI